MKMPTNGQAPMSSVVRLRLRLRRISMDAVLTSLALVLSIVERWIPLDLIVPVPGLKLGLANIVTLFALLRLGPVDALAVLLIRSLVMGVVMGPTTLLFSLTGGMLAMLVMWLLCHWEGKIFSVIGISLAGAAAHNTGQVAVASLVLNEPLLLLTYLPPLLLTGLATGTLTGVAAYPVVRRFPPIYPDPGPGGASPKKNSRIALDNKKFLVIALSFLLLQPVLAGCQPGQTSASKTPDGYGKFTYEFTGTFDTVIQFIGYARDEDEFVRLTQIGEKRFRELHQLYDAYSSYPGVNNVKTINDQAGRNSVQVQTDLLNLISRCLEWHRTVSDKTNIALGNVILLWQDYRDKALADPAQAAVPTDEELSAALAHADMAAIQVDEAAGTVYLSDPETRLDLGAVAKGYATELVAQDLMAAGAESMIINAGGSNVRLIGQPRGDRSAWNIGLQNPFALLPDRVTDTPESEPTIAMLNVNATSVVTSGDYQRYYLVNGKVYHHLIDPADGWPTHDYRALTVVTPDSGFADFLSTALFLLPYDQSRALAESLPGVEAVWVFPGGRVEVTAGLDGKMTIS